MARISSPPLTHLEALPVCRTIGVAKPWQVQPSTLIGPPPPLPGAWPDLTATSYFFSTARAVWQENWPFTISMWIGTFAAVFAWPQETALAAVVFGGDEEEPQATADVSTRASSATLPGKVTRAVWPRGAMGSPSCATSSCASDRAPRGRTRRFGP